MEVTIKNTQRGSREQAVHFDEDGPLLLSECRIECGGIRILGHWTETTPLNVLVSVDPVQVIAAARSLPSQLLLYGTISGQTGRPAIYCGLLDPTMTLLNRRGLMPGPGSTPSGRSGVSLNTLLSRWKNLVDTWARLG
jgi:hypothetical protein